MSDFKQFCNATKTGDFPEAARILRIFCEGIVLCAKSNPSKIGRIHEVYKADKERFDQMSCQAVVDAVGGEVTRQDVSNYRIKVKENKLSLTTDNYEWDCAAIFLKESAFTGAKTDVPYAENGATLLAETLDHLRTNKLVRLDH